MTKEVVLKPFNSVNRRFSEGDVVHADDDFAPLTYGSLKQRHFIGDPKKFNVPDKPAKAKESVAAQPHAYPAPKPPSVT